MPVVPEVKRINAGFMLAKAMGGGLLGIAFGFIDGGINDQPLF